MRAIRLILCYIVTVPLGQSTFTDNYLSFEGPVAYDDEKYENTTAANPEKRAKMLGYSAETHEIVTEDGYILSLHRINGSKKSPVAPNKPPVLLLHGLLDCSATWVLAYPEKSLAFTLADLGYDVWMGNARGTRYSRHHKWMTTKEKKYWMFSWHEIGKFDVPAMIDHVLGVSGMGKLLYIGHSQGTTAFFVCASIRPEYQSKVEAMMALAPVAAIPLTTQPIIRLLVPIAYEIKLVADLIGLYEFMPSAGVMQKLAQEICSDDAITRPLCDVGFFVFSPGERLMNESLPYLDYIPAGASSMQLLHYAQVINTGRFAEYDFGFIENLERYNSTIPPSYPLHKIQTKIYLHYALNDAFVNVLAKAAMSEFQDSAEELGCASDSVRQLREARDKAKDLYRLASELPNCEKHLVNEPSFTHTDFVWSKPIKVLLYDKIVSLMENHRDAIVNKNSTEELYT